MSKHTKGRQVQVSDSSFTATEIESIDHFGLLLPSSAEMMGYEQACAGAADRILALAEKQFEHRAELEKNQQKHDNEFRAMGVVCGIFVIILFAVLAVIFAFSGRQLEALAAIITPIAAAAVAVFRSALTGKR